MSARNRKQITAKVDKDPMQQDDPISKYDTGSHDRQQGSRQDKGDNSRQSTGQNWKARAKSLDKFEITIIIVVIAVIANAIVTILLSYDAVNKRYDVSANTPDERICNLERRVSEIDKKIDNFESDITEIKKKLETIETAKPWRENFENLEEKYRNFDAKIQDEMRVIKEQIPSEEKINEILNVGSNVNILQQRVDKLDEEWKGLKKSVEGKLKTAEDAVSSLKATLKQVEDKQEEWMISSNTTQQHVQNTSQLKQEMHKLRQECQQIQQRLETEGSDRNSTLKAVMLKLEKNLTKELTSNIDKVIKNLETEIEERKQNTLEMNRNLRDLETRVDNVNESLTTEIEEWKQNISDMNYNMRDLETRVDNINESLTTEIEERKQNISDMNRNMTDLKTRVDNVNESLTTEIEKRKQNIAILDEKITDTTSTVENDLKNHISDSSEKISQLQNQVREIDNINNKLGKLHTSVENQNETLSNVNTQLKYQEQVHSETSKGHESSFLRNDYAILIVFVVGVLILILFVMVCKTQNVHYDQAPSFVEAATGSLSRNFVSSKSVLDQIHQQPLTNEVCIISFYTSTQPLHRRLASSAISDISIKTAVIEKHEHIPMLPHVKTFLVFVDFNERNIILEDPNREIGDLKLTTVQGALKLGGHVYVIYVRDFGSKTLPEGQLINIKLTSINNHSLLHTLNEEKRVLTTYDEFTLYQKQHLKRNIWH